MKISEKLSTNIILKMRKEITGANGQEVLFSVKVDDTGIGCEVEVAARGNESAAPAIYPYMIKGDVVIHNHPSGTLSPSSNDIAVASRLGNEGIGFYIVNNEVTRLYCVAEPFKGKKVVPLDKGDLCSILLPGGVLSKEFDHYEVRDSQVEMLEEVIDTFNGSRIGVIEAGTGVGKSFSYLIPAIKWAAQNNERVIVSTATINLQQQLIEKDIPLINRITGLGVKSILLKGRGNYLCLRKLEEVYTNRSLFQEDNSEIDAIYQWSHTTSTGSKSDLSFMPDSSLWGKVCSESDDCMGLKCPMRDRCFVLEIRKKAAAANIIVVNHHLLFSDLAMRLNGAGFNGTAVLPPFKRVVFDEAHTIEKSATSFFSEKYNRFMLIRSLNTIYGRRGRVVFGVLEKVKNLLSSPEDLSSVPSIISDIRVKMDLLENTCEEYLGGDFSSRITNTGNQGVLGNLLSSLNELHGVILRLTETVRDAAGELFTEADDNTDVFELKVTLQRLSKLAGILGSFQNYDDDREKIFWVERSRTGKKEIYHSFAVTPLDISEMMRASVYETQSSVVFTSATLTVQHNFDFWRKRVGLDGKLLEDESRLSFSILKSPFEYRKQVLLGSPVDAPSPLEEGYQNYLTKIVTSILEVSEGKALVLFTSYSMLRKTYDDIAPRLAKKGITAIKQGDDDRARLLSSFNSDISSVLFATDSFWEGIDVPGDALRIVIIVKLPFKVPTDPIVKARVDKIKEEGGNPFYDLSLPEAAIRLKQGFGRLMRRKSDHGAVIVMDSRLTGKSYGKVLLRSLPESAKSIKETSLMLEDLENFLYSKDDGS